MVVGQDVDAHGFPVKDSFYITVASLPAKVKNILVHVNNFGGAGMRDVKSLCTRVVDASEQDPNAHRDLFVVTMPSAKGEHGNRTVAVLAKLYKEYVGMPVFPSSHNVPEHDFLRVLDRRRNAVLSCTS